MNQPLFYFMKPRFYQYPITPILAGLMPLAYLASANLDQINFDDISRLMYVIPLGAITLFLVSSLVLRDWKKASLISTGLVFLFFSYGHIYRILAGYRSFLGHHSILLPFFGGIGLLFLYWIFRSKRDLTKTVTYLNFVFFFLIMYSAFPVVIRFYQDSQLTRIRKAKILELQKTSNYSNLQPDVYFLVLDMYAREDVIQELYGYDNSTFLNDLKELGFYVVECSQTNYHETMLSLYSTLNMKYFGPTPDEFPGLEKYPFKLELSRDGMLNNKVRNLFESKGYKTVAFETGYGFSEWTDADFYYSLDKSVSLINDFEKMTMNTTMYLAYRDYSVVKSDVRRIANWNDYDESPEYRYQVKLNSLKSLDNIDRIPSPKFVFGHILIPHGPFVFDLNGNYVGGDVSEEDGYVTQVRYLNTRLEKIIKKIISESETPPVIIIESDHGVMEDDPNIRFKNLMAYYVPDQMKNQLYPTITPVNSFRLLMQTLGYGEFPLLGDYSFYLYHWDDPEVTYFPGSCPIKK